MKIIQPHLYCKSGYGFIFSRNSEFGIFAIYANNLKVFAIYTSLKNGEIANK